MYKLDELKWSTFVFISADIVGIVKDCCRSKLPTMTVLSLHKFYAYSDSIIVVIIVLIGSA